MNAGDFREWVVRPALQDVDLWSPIVEELIMGTAAQESGLQALEQGRGPALGVFQVEPATHHDLWENYLAYKPAFANKARHWCSDRLTIGRIVSRPNDDELVWNLRYAAVVCRLIYYRRPEPLPLDADPAALGAYWKICYNTVLGAGTVEQFVASFNRLIAGKSAVD